jgi:hypothetical protein
MPGRNKTMVDRWDYSKYEAGQYYAELNLKLSADNTYQAYIPFNIKDDRTVEVKELITGGLFAEKPATREARAPGLVLPEWAPYMIGGGIGLLFVLILVIGLLRSSKKK